VRESAPVTTKPWNSPAEADQLAVRVHVFAAARGEAARRHDAAGETHHQHARRAQQDVVHAFESHRQAQRRQARRHLAHHRDAKVGEVEQP
jgi:hypothetical protein